MFVISNRSCHIFCVLVFVFVYRVSCICSSVSSAKSYEKSSAPALPPSHGIEINFTRRKFLIKNQQAMSMCHGHGTAKARTADGLSFVLLPSCPTLAPSSHPLVVCVCFLLFLVYIFCCFFFDVLCFFGQHLMPFTRVIPAGQEAEGLQPVCTYIHNSRQHTLTCC